MAVLQVFCLYGLSKACLKTTENLYLAAGQPKIMTKINLLQLILMAVLIYPLTLRYGILGTGIVAAIPSALVPVLSNGVGAVSYSVFIWLTQKEEDRGDQAVNLSLKGLWRYALVNERGD